MKETFSKSYGTEGTYVTTLPLCDGYHYSQDEKDTTLYLVNVVNTGGISGGSCWDDSCPTPYSTGEGLGEFLGLNDVLTTFYPKVTLLEYKSLLSKVTMDTHTEYEYYGNAMDYAYNAISLESIYEFLVDKGAFGA